MSTHTTLKTSFLALLTFVFVTSPLTETASFAADTTSAVTLRVDIGGETKEIVIELDEANAPKTSANFKKLAASGFYDGIAFHRVIPNYIVQAGDPLTKDAAQKHLWGTGGPGYTIPAEIGLPHERGSVAMARLGDAANPNKASSGSQFYIALARLAKLDREYTVFGKVTSGLEYLDQIAATPADSNNNPAERVEIVAASVTGGVAPTLAAAAPADSLAMEKSKPSGKGAGKEKATAQSPAESDPKKKSWLDKTFGSKKDKGKEMAKADEPTSSAKPAAAPEPKPAAKSSPAPTPSPKPTATLASTDDSGSTGEPTYRNTDRSDARSAMPAQAVAGGDGSDRSDNNISLANEMKTRPPEKADDDRDVKVRPEQERGLIGRFLYRYW